MNETATTAPDARLPTVVTVGRHRIGRTLERLAPVVAGQVNLLHLSAAFDDAVRAVHALQKKKMPVDVLIAAGASGDWLREHVDIPVVMVEVRGFDLLHALSEARRLALAASAAVPGGEPPRIGLVSYGGPSPEVAQFEAMFGIGISPFSYQGADDAAACVQAMQQAGMQAVVAPGLVAELAERAGMASVLLYAEGAVRKAYAEALLLARHRHAQRARHQRLETVLHQLQDGVVTVDLQGRIQALNPTMAGLLGASVASLHGRPLEQFAPQLSVGRTLSTGPADGAREAEAAEDVVQIAGRTLSVRRAPIVENGEVTGALFACSDPVVIQRADRHLRASSRQQHVGARWRIDDYAGESPAAQRIRGLARQFAASDATVLIQGASGTGKELLAQGMHRASRRAAQPFLAVNCAALGESLLESELFGYEEGAFTGARRGGKTGLVEAAHTGTLFLDEIGDMPLPLQSRLLRVLQEREVLRVGSTTPVPVDIRVIAATHADLAAQVARGAFRRDLYYRLAVLRIQTPTLRERGAGDVAALAQALLAQRLGPAHDAAQAALLLRALQARTVAYAWPGNIRELGNWIERLAACRDHLLRDGAIDPDRWLEVFPECAAPLAAAPQRVDQEPPPPQESLPLKDARRLAERERLREVLASVQGHQGKACEILGISRATLWRRLKAAP